MCACVFVRMYVHMYVHTYSVRFSIQMLIIEKELSPGFNNLCTYICSCNMRTYMYVFAF